MGAITCTLYSPAGHCFPRQHWGKAQLWLLLPQLHINVTSELVLAFPRLHELPETSPHPWVAWLHLVQRSTSANEEMKDWKICHKFVGSARAECGTIFRKPGWEHHTFSKTRKGMQVLGWANREINSGKDSESIIARLRSYGSKHCLSSVPKCTLSSSKFYSSFYVCVLSVTAALLLEHLP